MTATVTKLPSRELSFDADLLARGWLAVGLASVKDPERPALSHTILVEFYEAGVQLVATDGFMLLSAWVPTDLIAPAPDLDEEPIEVAVVIDTHGRGAGLMAHLRRLAADTEDTGILVAATIRIGDTPPDPMATVELEGLASQALIIEHPGHEELALPLYEGEYPHWRKFRATHKAVKTSTIALHPDIIGRLAKLGKLYEGPIVWTFGGPMSAAALEIGPVRGVAMPMRWHGVDEAE